MPVLRDAAENVGLLGRLAGGNGDGSGLAHRPKVHRNSSARPAFQRLAMDNLNRTLRVWRLIVAGGWNRTGLNGKHAGG